MTCNICLMAAICPDNSSRCASAASCFWAASAAWLLACAIIICNTHQTGRALARAGYQLLGFLGTPTCSGCDANEQAGLHACN